MLTPEYNTVTTYRLVRLSPVQTALTVNIAAKKDILSVLSVGVESSVISYNAAAGEMSISGRVNYRLLVTTEEGPQGLSYNADFAEKIISPFIKDKTKGYFQCTVMDNDYKISGSKITLNTLVQTVATVVYASPVECLTACEGAFTKKQTLPVITSASIECVTTAVSEQLDFAANMQKVLLAESYVSVTDSFVSDNVLTVEGEAAVNLTYLDGEGKINSQLLHFPFSQETETSLGDTQQCLIACAGTKGTKIHIDIAEEEENKELVAELTVEVTLICSQQGETEVVQDLYSTKFKVAADYLSLGGTLLQGRYDYDLQIEEALSLDADRVVGVVNASAEVVSASVSAGGVRAEGITQGTVIYEKEGALLSKEFQIPFSKLIEDEYLKADSALTACAVISNIALKETSKGAEIMVSGKVDVVVTKELSSSVICHITEGEVIGTSQAGFEVCVGQKGDDLWATAKKLNMSEEQITSLNPDLKFPLEEAKRIVIYNRI